MPTNDELEQKIFADPDGVDAHLVYADWLTEHGDPRGELIMLQHGKKIAEADALLAAHRAHFLGDLPDDKQLFKADWALGFIRAARISAGDDCAPPEAYEELARLPSARFLRELTFGVAIHDDTNIYNEVVQALVAAGVAPTLRTLFFGDFTYEDCELSWSELGDLSSLWPVLARLRSLRLRAGAMTLGAIELPELRSFSVETGGFSAEDLRAVAAAKWPKLEHLEIYCGDDNYGASGGIADIQPILDARGIPALTSLGIVNCEWVNDLCKVIHKSRIVKQLKHLNLSKGIMTDEGVDALVENKEAFAHLESIDVSENFLSSDGEARLRGLCKAVHGGQREDEDPEYRYVVVGE
jgi:uncharacterized protein (TIGR02996 family)